jgi:hypothetical protein
MTSFLPGVPADAVTAALLRSAGSEMSLGKFDSPESSDALVANGFGWFLDKPGLLPGLPSVPMGRPASIELEVEFRFPWKGGFHPWAEVAITTATTLVGVVAKRYEPFRPRKSVTLTEGFDDFDWGPGMARFDAMRRSLADGSKTFATLDAVQLIKHAYALKTTGSKRGKGIVLVYLHATPSLWASGKPVSPDAIARHQAEITDLARALKGDDVVFVPLRWGDLLTQWAKIVDIANHVAAFRERFGTV